MTLLAGFADPVAESQACFRAVLEAMSRPGSLHRVSAPADVPPPLDRSTAAVVLTLADAETPLWLDDAAAAARGWADFHCGAPAVALAQAALAVSLGGADLGMLEPGTDDAPELGATLILQVAALGRGRGFRLSGPGLAAPCVLAVEGLPADFAASWAANRGRFPRGVDLVLCAGDQLAALPRTVAVEAV